MGCIVNGPGEMADADFGYVGGAADKINLYVGKDCVEKGIHFEESDERLINLIKNFSSITCLMSGALSWKIRALGKIRGL